MAEIFILAILVVYCVCVKNCENCDPLPFPRIIWPWFVSMLHKYKNVWLSRSKRGWNPQHTATLSASFANMAFATLIWLSLCILTQNWWEELFFQSMLFVMLSVLFLFYQAAYCRLGSVACSSPEICFPLVGSCTLYCASLLAGVSSSSCSFF